MKALNIQRAGTSCCDAWKTTAANAAADANKRPLLPASVCSLAYLLMVLMLAIMVIVAIMMMVMVVVLAQDEKWVGGGEGEDSKTLNGGPL